MRDQTRAACLLGLIVSLTAQSVLQEIQHNPDISRTDAGHMSSTQAEQHHMPLAPNMFSIHCRVQVEPPETNCES